MWRPLTTEWDTPHNFLFVPLLKLKHFSSKETKMRQWKRKPCLGVRKLWASFLSRDIPIYMREIGQIGCHDPAALLLHSCIGEQALEHLTSAQSHRAHTRKENEEGQKSTLFTSNSALLLLKTFTEASYSGLAPLLFGFFKQQFFP